MAAAAPDTLPLRDGELLSVRDLDAVADSDALPLRLAEREEDTDCDAREALAEGDSVPVDEPAPPRLNEREADGEADGVPDKVRDGETVAEAERDGEADAERLELIVTDRDAEGDGDIEGDGDGEYGTQERRVTAPVAPAPVVGAAPT